MKTEKQIIEELEILSKERDFSKYGRGGFIELNRETHEYKGVKYDIAVLQYYHLKPTEIVNMGSTFERPDKGQHVVVEYPKESKELIEAVKKVDEYSEFLYHDTLHTEYNHMTTVEQIEECHRMAREDINEFEDLIKENKRLKK